MMMMMTVPAAENNTRVGLARCTVSVGVRAYNGGMGAEPAGVQGQSPRWGSEGKAP